MKNIVFMGTPSYASKILEKIYKAKFNILAIYTQPDKPVGRSQTLTPPDVKKLAIDLGLNDIVYQPKSLKESGVKEHIKSLNPDIIIV
ncbi:MAG: methionyl-tRNA formyltransferase, partial [Campylobacter sp.]|nr:methionyl-tRNA formyltransferase [Campylobacter sp.]